MKLILDTNVVRHLAAGEPGGEALTQYKADGGTIHLADGAVVELLAQLHARRLSWSQWSAARLALSSILDPTTPVMIGGRELLATVGIAIDSAKPTLPQAEQVALNREMWNLLQAANSDAEFARRSAVIALGGQHQRISVDTSQASSVVASEKAAWEASFIRARAAAEDVGFAVPATGDRRETIDELARQIGASIDEATGPLVPPASVRLDAMIRVQILLSLRSLRAKQPYNAAKHANDVFDHDILRYLALPAAVCTCDRGIRNDLRAAGAWQVDWVVSTSELANPEVRARLLELRWPGDAAS